ncbi:hypothetical protein GCM10009836_25640 [Pseudonocardia ailaonensis]|uniref:Uncharacterized protein n=1 Tax=Pseudonocardia ailaonensis TaxID=367279 RepID=A0ABN2MZ36_9PSEU
MLGSGRGRRRIRVAAVVLGLLVVTGLVVTGCGAARGGAPGAVTSGGGQDPAPIRYTTTGTQEQPPTEGFSFHNDVVTDGRIDPVELSGKQVSLGGGGGGTATRERAGPPSRRRCCPRTRT